MTGARPRSRAASLTASVRPPGRRPPLPARRSRLKELVRVGRPGSSASPCRSAAMIARSPRFRGVPPDHATSAPILRRRVRQHRRQRRVLLQVVEHDLVVRVAVRVPRVLPVLGVAATAGGTPARRRHTNDVWSLPEFACGPGTCRRTLSVISVGSCATQRARLPPAFRKPCPSSISTRHVPLSWLNATCSPAMTSGWSSPNASDPIVPCSSPPQCPTRIVRLRVRIRRLQDAHRLQHHDRAGAVVRRARRAVPAVEVRGEQHVLVRQFASPCISATTLNIGTSAGVACVSAVRRTRGPWLFDREPVQQPVVLARHVDATARAPCRAEDLVHAPAVRPQRRADADDARRVEALRRCCAGAAAAWRARRRQGSESRRGDCDAPRRAAR